jgi:adhesin transport system membrane fusion protein
MLFNAADNEDDPARQRHVERLENFHRRSHSFLLSVLLIGFVGFIAWAMTFRIDEVTRASGEVIASSRVQVIQAVDGGVLSELMVTEGDRVIAGQLLARLDQTRVGAKVGEVEARLFGLKAKAIRLRAEVTGAAKLNFPTETRKALRERQDVERALFKQRRIGFNEEVRTLKVAVRLAKKELELNDQLLKSGDVNGMELIRTKRALNDADARLINRKNTFLEEALIVLSKAEY